MTKPKGPRRSRLIRKWDGTPVQPEEATTASTTEKGSAAPLAPQPQRTEERDELGFDFEHEDELTHNG